MLILGIESSCDETAASVVRDGHEILSSIISSQIDSHRPFGGVVPELASREHLEKIEFVIERALTDAAVKLEDIGGIAVTQGPGLIGSLLVGVCYAKSLAFARDIPLVGVNHIEGHVYSVVFENPPIQYPAMALIVSGGHTNLFWIPEEGQYKVVSRTRDDAAGEAFDKVAKMLGLGYPGGPIIENLAAQGDPRAVKFTKAKISDGRPDFSFSGLKTAVSRYVRENEIVPMRNGDKPSKVIADLAASFQQAVVAALVGTMEKQAAELQPKTLIVAGGVACNQSLRQHATRAAERLGVPVYFPSKHLSTDNAAMIAAAGAHRLKFGEAAAANISADITMRLQNLENEDEALRKSRVRYKL
ncbi:MAG: tRNA (adenosine(37)-N6)-threonylcarbamoyltransferase complex transferase subunit TsaD [bacterium]|nr:tRNA (adenosine(37)-N6)-threonylcarbamoyltransferase complex transferase subunit TsaD [bacterium]